MQEKELQADIDELKALLEAAQRPYVKNAIKQEIIRLEANLQKIKSLSTPADPQSESTGTSSFIPKPSKIYETLKSYSWDQTDTEVKVYILLEGIKSSGAQVESSFEKRGFDLKIQGYKNKDFRLAIQNLSEAIDAQKSQAVVKNNNITLRLVKKKESTKWKDLIQKEGDVSKPETPQQPDKSADPSASLMDMMKKMYEEGDDNMKKTIAEAWTKSREKGGAPDML